MKKKISLLLCAIALTFCFTGCSAAQTAEMPQDTTSLEETAEFIITNFSQMEEQDFEQFENLPEFQLDYTMMQTGLRVDGKDFLNIIEAWKAGEEAAGEYVSHGEFSAEVKGSKIVLSTLAQYEEKEAELIFTFDKGMNLESLAVSGALTTGQTITQYAPYAVIAIGVVFVLTTLRNRIASKNEEEETAKADNSSVTATSQMDELELIAVITAAIAAQEGKSADQFVVRSIRRRPTNKWR